MPVARGGTGGIFIFTGAHSTHRRVLAATSKQNTAVNQINAEATNTPLIATKVRRRSEASRQVLCCPMSLLSVHLRPMTRRGVTLGVTHCF